MADIRIPVRVSPERKAQYESRASEVGLTVSEWLRRLADNDCSGVVFAPEEEKVKRPAASKPAKQKETPAALAAKAKEMAVEDPDADLPRGSIWGQIERARRAKARKEAGEQS